MFYAGDSNIPDEDVSPETGGGPSTSVTGAAASAGGKKQRKRKGEPEPSDTPSKVTFV